MSDFATNPVPGLDQESSSDVDDVLAADDVAAPLIEPDQGWIGDDEAAVVAMEAVGDVGPLAAEESAVHVIDEDEAPGVTWDESPGYVEENPTEQPFRFDGDPSSAAEA